MALVHEARLLLSCRGAFGQVINDIVQLSGARERLNAVMITNIIGSKGDGRLLASRECRMQSKDVHEIRAILVT